jgi:hypothetical protein
VLLDWEGWPFLKSVGPDREGLEAMSRMRPCEWRSDLGICIAFCLLSIGSLVHGQSFVGQSTEDESSEGNCVPVCWSAGYVYAEDALSDSIAVLPTEINVGDRSWTFLTFGPHEAGLTQLTLCLDGLVVAPSLVERTTLNSRLWTFSFPPRDTACSAVIRLSTDAKQPRELSMRTYARLLSDHYRPIEGSISIAVVPNSIGYRLGHESQTATELIAPNPSLLAALLRIGVRSIAKKHPMIAEENPEDDLQHAPSWLPQWARTLYTIHVDPRHNEHALAQILKTTSCITDARAVSPVIQH